jgi:glycosyltransferase involved in cell wall biosynthesis
VAEYGAMDIVHLNILMKAGLFAWRLKKKYKLPYILTEHWTGYDKESKNGYRQQSRLYKFLSKKIYRNCVYPLPVTHDLGEKMNSLMGEKTFKAIPNVVDTQFFYPDIEHKNFKTRFIHASTLGYHKNIQGLLNATRKLYQQRKDFELYILGPASVNLIHQAEDYGLADSCIFFAGQVSYHEVSEHIRKADAMVMFSRYENLPCVILEALTCGLPVISTDVGGIREVINDDNGILIPSEDEDALLQAMNRMLDSKEKYNRQKIASDAKNKFSYEVVGKQFDEIYKEVLSYKV